MTKKIIKIDPKTGDFLVYSEEEWNTLNSQGNADFSQNSISTTSNAITYTKQAKTVNKEDSDLICPSCQGHLPDISFFTQRKTKCIWCDASYWEKHDK